MKAMKPILIAVLCIAMSLTAVPAFAAVEEPAGIRWFPVPENRRYDDVWEVECVKTGCLCQRFTETVEDTGRANFLDTVYDEDGSLTVTRNGNDLTDGIYWPRIRTISLETAPAFDMKTADTLYFDFTAHAGTGWNIMFSINGMNIKFSKIISDACGKTGVTNSDYDGGEGTFKGSINIQDALAELAAESGTESAVNAAIVKNIKKTYVPQLQVFCVGEVGASVTIRELYVSTAADIAGDNCTFVDMGLISGLGDSYYGPAEDELPEPVLLGDTDLDGTLTLADATQLFYHINGTVTLTGDALIAADYSADFTVNMHDAVRLFYMVNGLI